MTFSWKYSIEMFQHQTEFHGIFRSPKMQFLNWSKHSYLKQSIIWIILSSVSFAVQRKQWSSSCSFTPLTIVYFSSLKTCTKGHDNVDGTLQLKNRILWGNTTVCSRWCTCTSRIYCKTRCEKITDIIYNFNSDRRLVQELLPLVHETASILTIWKI